MTYYWFLLSSLRILLCVFSEHSNDDPFYFFTLPTHDLVTIDSDDLLTCFSSRTSFSRLPFPCTLPYSSWSVRRIRLSFVNFITFLLSSYWCTVSVFYSLTCMFAFLQLLTFLKSPFLTSSYQLGLKLFAMIHQNVTNVFPHIHSITKRLWREITEQHRLMLKLP